MNLHLRRCGAVVAALVLCSLTGCYSVSEEPERTVIRFAPVWRAVMVAVPLALIAGGLLLCYYKPTRIPGLLVVCGAVAVSGFLVPSMYGDAVVVTPTEISQPTGFWFARTPRGFRYADVRSVSVREEKEGASVMRVWTLRNTDGTTRELDPGDLWNVHEALIVAKLRGYGVKFE